MEIRSYGQKPCWKFSTVYLTELLSLFYWRGSWKSHMWNNSLKITLQFQDELECLGPDKPLWRWPDCEEAGWEFGRRHFIFSVGNQVTYKPEGCNDQLLWASLFRMEGGLGGGGRVEAGWPFKGAFAVIRDWDWEGLQSGLRPQGRQGEGGVHTS